MPRPTSAARPSRKTPVVVIGIAALAVIGAAWWWTRGSPFAIEPRADRNVLLVTIDTLRADALSSYGGRAQTPNLDRLAARGARFTFAHAHAVVTLPSHATILTGAYPYEHGVRENHGYRLRTGQTTLATRLKASGFATGAFVGAFPLDQRFGLNAGFDVYDDRIGEMGTTVDFAVPERRADAVVQPALEWIGSRAGKWFAWVHVFDPHAPYRAPEAFAGRYPGDPYAGEVAWTDAALGPLFDRLASLTRPTLVIVTADHGESLGEHGELTHGVFAYEPTLRVPLLVAEIDPADLDGSGGVIVDAAVRHIDIVPTVLDAIGAPPDSSLPGGSLREPIAGRGVADRPMYFEAMTANLSRGWAPLRGVLSGREKYIDLPTTELYALDKDPREARNVAGNLPDRARVLANTLRGYNVAPPAQQGEETSAVRDRLRALGYIGGSSAPARERYTEQDDPKLLIELDAMLHRAGELYESGQLPEAVSLFQQVAARRPDTADAYRYLAFVYWKSGQPDAAIETLERALRNGVTHRDIRVKLGVYLAESGRAARAIGLLEGLAGDDPDALNALGIAYAQSGRPADAMATFRKVIDLDATSGLAWQNIGTLHLRAGDRASAETALRRALAIDQTLAGAHTALGVALSDSGRKAEAIDAWTRAVAIAPRDFDALYNLTVTLVELGRRDQARPYAERYVSTAPRALYARDIDYVKRLLGL